jgi:hypothetical protein
VLEAARNYGARAFVNNCPSLRPITTNLLIAGHGCEDRLRQYRKQHKK